MKMYILIRDSIPLGFAMPAIGHGVSACQTKFQDTDNWKKWAEESFVKIVCKLNDKEFNRAKGYSEGVLMTESELNGEETVLVFCPRPDDEWPKPFRFYRLYK